MSTLSLKRFLSFSLVATGLLFLCNPNLSIVDVMPDAVGYFLLAAGIVGIADVNPYFAEARRRFLILAWISIAKMLSIGLLVYVLSVNAEQRAMVSVFSLGFAVVEAIFVFPAISAFLKGFSYVGERDGVLSVLPPLKALTTYSYVFLILKHLGSFLPEMVLISVAHLDTFGDYVFNPIRLYPFLLIFVAVLVLGFGIYFLRLWREYLAALQKDESFAAYAENKIAQNSKVLAANALYRSKSRVLLLLIGALLLAIDLIADRNALIPDFLSGICFLLFFLCFRKDNRLSRFGAIAAGAYTAFSLTATVFLRIYFSHFDDYTAITHVRNARAIYLGVEIFSVLEGAALLLLLFLLYSLLNGFLKQHTGLLPKEERQTESALHRELKRKNVLMLLFGMLPAIFHVVEVFLLKLNTLHIVSAEEANEFYKEGQVLYFSRFEGSFWLTLLLSLVWTVYGITFLLRLREEMRVKYCDFIDNP